MAKNEIPPFQLSFNDGETIEIINVASEHFGKIKAVYKEFLTKNSIPFESNVTEIISEDGKQTDFLDVLEKES